ncbi:MAG: proton-conducting transporter membrane subunit [candidate division WOR-3 bacterium]|nr:proton-conducting transporter membrane subunit [candidate division WOR-3 bacterium]
MILWNTINIGFVVPTIVPLIVGLLILFYPKRHFTSWKNPVYFLTVITTAFIFTDSLYLLIKSQWRMSFGNYLLAYPFSSSVLLATLLLGFLIALYSYNQKKKSYFTYLLWTISASSLAILSNNLIILLLAWGGVAVLLYLLISLGKPGAEVPAYKALVMVGGSDILMLIGAALIYYLTGTLTMSEISISLTGALPILAYILLLIGSLTKAGAMPFHTWIIDSAEKAPVSVMALLPAAFDKLLGIYLLARISLDLFKVLSGSAMSIVLMIIGSISIIAAVSMALVQKNVLKLLSFHAVSQVGYMVLGIGTGVPIGIIGGLFHMINNVIYKSALFLGAGAVEEKTNETSLEKLGGLARYMPITFLVMFISSMAISGIPPLNGFASKWLVYQGVIEVAKTHSYAIFFLVIAMFGSVLTLASFLKVLHSTFLGEKSKAIPKVKEVGFGMIFPMVILAFFCIVLGIFANLPINYLFRVVFATSATAIGIWNSGLATILIIIGIVLGFIIYLLSKQWKVRSSEVFIGGEVISPKPQAVLSLPDGVDTITGVVDLDEAKIPGTYFYDSIKKIKLIDDTYRVADNKFFDIFEQSKKLISLVIRAGKIIHNGLLQTYLGWLFLGGIAVIAIYLILLLR